MPKQIICWVCFLGFIVLTGCAIKAKRVNIVSPENPEVSFCGDLLQDNLGLAPIVDERPAIEIKGNRPGGLFLLLWNQRKGDYVSADTDFLESVRPSMLQQMRRSITESNCFKQAKVLETDIPVRPRAGDLLDLSDKENVRYILLSRLKHFYGKQSQNSYFFILVFILGSQDYVEPARGYSEMVFALYDTKLGRVVWSDQIQATADSPVKGSYPKVAQESFARLSEKLANQLYRFVQSQ